MTCRGHKENNQQEMAQTLNFPFPFPFSIPPVGYLFRLAKKEIPVFLTGQQELRYDRPYREAISLPSFSNNSHRAILSLSPIKPTEIGHIHANLGEMVPDGSAQLVQYIVAVAPSHCRGTRESNHFGVFFCVYFSPELRKACITAQMPLGVSSWIKRLNSQANRAGLWRSNYSALTDTNFKLPGLKLFHNPYCVSGSSILSH